MNHFRLPRLLAAALLLPLAAPVGAQARPQAPEYAAAMPARGARSFRLVAPVVSIEGVRVDGAGATLEQEPFGVLSLALAGYGTFYVSDRPFEGAARAGEFEGTRLAFAADGRSVRVRSAESILGVTGLVPAYARFDPAPQAGPPVGRVPAGRLVLGALSAPGTRPAVVAAAPAVAPARAVTPAARPAVRPERRAAPSVSRRAAVEPARVASRRTPRVARSSTPGAVPSPVAAPMPSAEPRVGTTMVAPPTPAAAQANAERARTPVAAVTPLVAPRPRRLASRVDAPPAPEPVRRDTIPPPGTTAVAPSGAPTWTGTAPVATATPPPAPPAPAVAPTSWVLPTAELVDFDFTRLSNAEDIWLRVGDLPIQPVQAAQATGDVLVLFVTNEEGAVVRTEIARGIAPSLNVLAEGLVRQMRFIPPMVGGLPAALRSQVTVRFAL